MRSAARCSVSNGGLLGGAQLPGGRMHSVIAAAGHTGGGAARLFVSHPCRGACRGGRVQAGVPRSNEPSGHSLHFQGAAHSLPARPSVSTTCPVCSCSPTLLAPLRLDSTCVPVRLFWCSRPRTLHASGLPPSNDYTHRGAKGPQPWCNSQPRKRACVWEGQTPALKWHVGTLRHCFAFSNGDGIALAHGTIPAHGTPMASFHSIPAFPVDS